MKDTLKLNITYKAPDGDDKTDNDDDDDGGKTGGTPIGG